jgi:phage terminase large subunit GpA-like protein
MSASKPDADLLKLREVDYSMETEDLGETYPVAPCPECDTETYYHLVRTEGRKRLKLPVVGSVPMPTPKRTRFRLVCPHCENSIRMNRTATEEAKAMLEATQRYIDGEMSEEKYGERLEGFHRVLEEGL